MKTILQIIIIKQLVLISLCKIYYYLAYYSYSAFIEEVNQQKITLEIWDTAAFENNLIIKSYLKDADAIFLFFSFSE